MKKSLALGRVAENYVVDLFKFFGLEAEVIEGKNDDYDLICSLDDDEFTVEVKFDVMAQKTGNIAIEYYNSKSCKPSGIDATKADLWAQVLQDGSTLTLWLSKVDSLKKFIKCTPPFRNLTSVGDDNACIYLYNENDILHIQLCRVDNLQKEKFQKLIRSML